MTSEVLLDRVEEKTNNMKAKAQALDEMIDSGVLTDYTSNYPSGDASIEFRVRQSLFKQIS